jgi:hypothetical protein
MSPYDLQACSNREAQQRNEGIPKSNAIDVVGTRPADQIACGIIASEKQVENGKVDVPGRCNFPGRSSTLAPGRWTRRVDICANEPSSEPSWSNVLHWRWRSIVERLCDRRQIDVVGSQEVLQALADAPEVFPRLPVKLICTQPTREIVDPSVGGIEFVDQAYRPGGQSGVGSQGHDQAYCVCDAGITIASDNSWRGRMRRSGG